MNHSRNLIMAIAVIGLLGILGSCVHSNRKPDWSSDQVVELLKANLGVPYYCSIEQVGVLLDPAGSRFVEFSVHSDIVFQDAANSYEISSGVVSGIPTDPILQIREGSTLHVIRKKGIPGDLVWECQMWELPESPGRPLAIFPRGGWGVIPQVLAMMEELGVPEISHVHSEVFLTWKAFPKNLVGEFSELFALPSRSFDSIEELRLGVGVGVTERFPTTLEILFGSGESVRFSFTDFVLIPGTFNEKGKSLLSQYGFSEPDSCICEDSEINRIVPRRLNSSHK